MVMGHKMYLSRDDKGISRELMAYGVHEPVTTELLRQEIKRGMRVVDIGANIGYYTLQAASLVGESGEVIAIEPVPENVSLLRMNVKANGYQNVRILEAAIGSDDGTAQLYLAAESNWSSLIRRHANQSHIDVRLWKLDTLLAEEERVDYIKMDIEGSEAEVINGMIGILRRYRPGMFIEAHPTHVGGKAIVRLLEQLRDLGYETKYVVDKAFNYPTVRTNAAVETLSISRLMEDKRVSRGEAVVTLFLEAQAEIPA